MLILRCFELRSYAEIANIMGGTELKARVLFFHAKHALKRCLHNRGYGRRYFLTSLTLFGIITGIRTKSASAALTVTSNLLKTGTIATTIGAVSTQLGLITAAVITVGLAGGTVYVCSSNADVPTETISQMTLPIQSDTRWAFPTQIINAYDPEGNGWEAVSAKDGEDPSTRIPLDLQTILTGQWYNCHLIIPEGHWIEFGFGGPINNGIGFDIRYDCLDTGNFPDVFLIGGQDRTLKLTSSVIEPLENQSLRVSFDLTNVEVPFEPAGVRVQGRGLEGQWQAPVLCSLEAQISL